MIPFAARPRLLGEPAGRGHLEMMRDWLAPFPDAVSTSCLDWITDKLDETWILAPNPGLARFRLESARAIKDLQFTLDSITTLRKPRSRFVWLLENLDNQGLDDFEVEGVLAGSVDILDLCQIGRGAAASRLMVRGNLRQEIIGMAFRLDGCGKSETRALGGLDSSRLPAAALFLDHYLAQALLKMEASELVRRLRGMLSSRRVSVALWVEESRAARAMQDLASEAAPLRALSQDQPVSLVAFAEPVHPNDQAAFTAALRSADLRFCVFDPDGLFDCASSERGVRSEPYYRAGAFQPQRFDFRTPAGVWDDRMWIELCAMPVVERNPQSSKRDQSEVLSALWDARVSPHTFRLAELLDFKRMERYHIDSAGSPELRQRYHEYRVYNHAPPEPSPRTTLFCCGRLTWPGRLRETLKWFAKTGKRRSTWKVATPFDFFAAAESEARRRTLPDTASALARQVAGHSYIDCSDPAGPLREDVLRFLDFLPEKTGRTIEVGSGNGQVGVKLRARTRLCVSIDLCARGAPGEQTNPQDHRVLGDAHVLPFRDAIFDTVVANNVLEHLHDPLACLVELRRVLREEGMLYTLIPLDALNPAHSIRTHPWKADLESIRRALAQSGFTMGRSELIDLYALGVDGSFPTCNGLVCVFEAAKRAGFGA